MPTMSVLMELTTISEHKADQQAFVAEAESIDPPPTTSASDEHGKCVGLQPGKDSQYAIKQVETLEATLAARLVSLVTR